MQVQMNRNGVDLGPQVEELIRRKVQKIERLLDDFDPDTITLKIDLEKIDRKKTVVVRTVLDLPNKVLRAEKSHKNVMRAISLTFDSLWREVKRYKEFLRGEPAYKRKVRPSIKERLASAELREALKEEYLTIVLRLLKRLYNFTRREIQFRIWSGQLRKGDIAIADVLDEAVVEVFKKLPDEYDERWIERELFRSVIQIINRVVREKRIPRVPLEKTVDAYEDIDTEIYEFYQPDNLYHLEDLVPDNFFPEPDNAIEQEDIKRYIDQVLSGLPDKWRYAFYLTVFEEFTPEEIAMVQGISPEEVKKYVQLAREYLREKLKETGLELKRV